jgi:hypothetical protein
VVEKTLFKNLAVGIAKKVANIMGQLAKLERKKERPLFEPLDLLPQIIPGNRILMPAPKIGLYQIRIKTAQKKRFFVKIKAKFL